jgi:hypothetical protein
MPMCKRGAASNHNDSNAVRRVIHGSIRWGIPCAKPVETSLQAQKQKQKERQRIPAFSHVDIDE